MAAEVFAGFGIGARRGVIGRGLSAVSGDFGCDISARIARLRRHSSHLFAGKQAERDELVAITVQL